MQNEITIIAITSLILPSLSLSNTIIISPSNYRYA